MPDQTNIEKYKLQEKVLKDYAEGRTIGEIVTKYNSQGFEFSWQNIAYFLDREEMENTEAWRYALENRNINVASDLKAISNKLKSMLNDYEDVKEGVEGKDPESLKVIFMANREMRETMTVWLKQLAVYTTVIEKLHSMKSHDEERKVIMAAIKEESPETAMKIIERLKNLKEEKRVLEE